MLAELKDSVVGGGAAAAVLSNPICTCRKGLHQATDRRTLVPVVKIFFLCRPDG